MLGKSNADRETRQRQIRHPADDGEREGGTLAARDGDCCSMRGAVKQWTPVKAPAKAQAGSAMFLSSVR
jgi:hypothetical protein